jgi:hypothetical protein
MWDRIRSAASVIVTGKRAGVSKALGPKVRRQQTVCSLPTVSTPDAGMELLEVTKTCPT